MRLPPYDDIDGHPHYLKVLFSLFLIQFFFLRGIFIFLNLFLLYRTRMDIVVIYSLATWKTCGKFVRFVHLMKEHLVLPLH